MFRALRLMRMNITHMIGTRVSARIQELNKVIVTTLNSDAVYSPVLDSDRKMGRNAAEVVSEDNDDVGAFCLKDEGKRMKGEKEK